MLLKGGGMMALTEKQKRFCDEYLIDLNATRAYREAYPAVKRDETAAQAGSRLLRNVNVIAYVEKRIKEREHRTEITQDRVLRELAAIGFADITDFVSTNGNSVKIKPTEDVPKDKIGAIAGIKEGANGIEVKTNDKVKALELLGRHLGMFNDKLEIDGNVGVQIVDDINDT